VTEEHYLLQFRSDTDPREEYILITSRKPEKWYELTDPAFKLTAAAVLAHIVKGHWAHFLEPREHRYWLRGG
jgi:hypothetical protein